MKIVNDVALRAILLNDTSTAAHHGSRYVVAAIREQLAKRNTEIIASAAVGADWEQDDAIIEAFKFADLVVVNGEGTLHHGADAGRRLLRILQHPLRGNIPVVFINMLWQENPLDWGELLRGAALIAVRDTRSQRSLAANGVQAAFCPDLSFSHAWPVRSARQQQSHVAFGDSVYPDVSRALWDAYREYVGPKQYLPIRARKRHEAIYRKLSIGQHFDNIRHGMRGFLRSLADPNVFMARDTVEYLTRLSAAGFHVTGRYHAVCLSIVVGVPFVAVASNSNKIEALIDDVGLNRRRVVKEASNALRWEVGEFSQSEILNIERWRALALQSSSEIFDNIVAIPSRRGN